ncbi:hypothetical protein BJ742DRAFT_872213 [Cladochytrium replicatum]|nr:hypothetical protein BJ742DRAFT_872213 [Cladochytrium replicatum]
MLFLYFLHNFNESINRHPPHPPVKFPFRPNHHNTLLELLRRRVYPKFPTGLPPPCDGKARLSNMNAYAMMPGWSLRRFFRGFVAETLLLFALILPTTLAQAPNIFAPPLPGTPDAVPSGVGAGPPQLFVNIDSSNCLSAPNGTLGTALPTSTLLASRTCNLTDPLQSWEIVYPSTAITALFVFRVYGTTRCLQVTGTNILAIGTCENSGNYTFRLSKYGLADGRTVYGLNNLGSNRCLDSLTANACRVQDSTNGTLVAASQLWQFVQAKPPNYNFSIPVSPVASTTANTGPSPTDTSRNAQGTLSPTSSPPADPLAEPRNIAIIIGGAVAGVAVILLAIASVWLVRSRRRVSKQETPAKVAGKRRQQYDTPERVRPSLPPNNNRNLPQQPPTQPAYAPPRAIVPLAPMAYTQPQPVRPVDAYSLVDGTGGQSAQPYPGIGGQMRQVGAPSAPMTRANPFADVPPAPPISRQMSKHSVNPVVQPPSADLFQRPNPIIIPLHRPSSVDSESPEASPTSTDGGYIRPITPRNDSKTALTPNAGHSPGVPGRFGASQTGGSNTNLPRAIGAAGLRDPFNLPEDSNNSSGYGPVRPIPKHEYIDDLTSTSSAPQRGASRRFNFQPRRSSLAPSSVPGNGSWAGRGRQARFSEVLSEAGYDAPTRAGSSRRAKSERGDDDYFNEEDEESIMTASTEEIFESVNTANALAAQKHAMFSGSVSDTTSLQGGAIPVNNNAPLEITTAIWKFEGSGVDELSLEPGDLVIVMNKFDDEWGRGWVRRTKRTGFFPLASVTPIVPSMSALKDADRFGTLGTRTTGQTDSTSASSSVDEGERTTEYKPAVSSRPALERTGSASTTRSHTGGPRPSPFSADAMKAPEDDVVKPVPPPRKGRFSVSTANSPKLDIDKPPKSPAGSGKAPKSARSDKSDGW